VRSALITAIVILEEKNDGKKPINGNEMDE